MARRRDAFNEALDAVRRRVLEGRVLPGDRLPILAIAHELGLSTTPVREALARLAGEGFIEKDGGDYRRPRLDATALIQLFGLRRLYVTAAASTAILLTAERRQEASRSPALVSGASDRGADLLREVIDASADRTLQTAYRRCANQLAPFVAFESQVITRLDVEWSALNEARARGDSKEFKKWLTIQFRARVAAASRLVSIADGDNILRI